MVATDNLTLMSLIVLTAVCAALFAVAPGVWPLTLVVLPMFLGGLFLSPRDLPWFLVFVLAVLAFAVTKQSPLTPRLVIGVVVLFLLGFITLLSSFRRSRLGVAGMQGESMLVDLRDRILSQGTLPDLPANWYAESALRSAGGTPFAGDFVVASRKGNDSRLDFVVVDVSGKGEDAGTRALLLSGAFGGLLVALTAEEFLPAANDYLMRQNWDEGFATAVHLTIDLDTGDFAVRTAGHPPAIQLLAGSGKWIVHESEGPILGLMDDAEFTVVRGRMRSGDAVLLYTDGLVETPTRDISLGIDKLQGQGERLLRSGFDNAARRLIDALGSRNDDRALLLLHRR
ncbi:MULTISPECIES: PP2C family protein-serine/threonine phosphatase [unclassified Nocardioides]|uniref:PP2C family protein-serine/threonine phosphatase n=1 Tax=unclassified Nocardioides TaxID=2615069 RepID=UPI0006FB212A|nr:MULTISPECIES: PP2C family protein-serine/threonine phosphatase [unclassified Nocardioides]KQY63652.1 stage II sporulation E family protein [Nocardioides sp. Root140]KRF15668.1 stage II sporulation E family protein [Nocardioides sp. Soil796]